MKRKISTETIEALKEAIEFEKGTAAKTVKTNKITLSPLPSYRGKQVKKIRNQLNLTQSIFAMFMGVSVKTVEAWESGKNIPNGTAQRMLYLLEKDNKLPEKYEIMHVGHAS